MKENLFFPHFLKSLQVTNFRNLFSGPVYFSERMNCIFGDNGNGKTNLLEAIYYLVHHKSFRKNVTFPQILNTDCSKPEIIFQAAFETERKVFSYSGKVSSKDSYWARNAIRTQKKLATDLLFIGPFDAQLFFTEISYRRFCLDRLLGFYLPKYKKELSQYQKILKYRNKLLSLKPIQYRRQILSLDESFSERIVFIERARLEFLQVLSPFFEQSFEKLFDAKCKISFELVSEFKEISKEKVLAFLEKKLEKDETMGMTLLGPHRDDFMPYLDGFKSTEYCSLGQQKMLYLALIFAYIDIFMYKFKTYPIVLVDDVSGELDQVRWTRFVKYLEDAKFQVFISTANERFAKALQSISNSFRMRVNAGRILAL